MTALLTVANVSKRFPIKAGIFARPVAWVHAVSDVSLEVMPGETLGIVGESGCGKSTLAKMIVRLLRPDTGNITFDGHDLTHLSHSALRPLRRNFQMVFQDPFASLNPRMTIGQIIAEPLHVHRLGSRRDRKDRVAALLELVGLSADAVSRYPHEFSGGQRQRVGIARAIAVNPKLIVADEPVSALDASVRGEILNLLLDLQERLGLAYIFIAHDMTVVAQISHRIAVMYLGKIVEVLPATNVLQPSHPYTRALLAAVPEADPDKARALQPIGGDVPSPITPPSGCHFHPRCAFRQFPRCREDAPVLERKANGHWAACHFAEDVVAAPSLTNAGK